MLINYNDQWFPVSIPPAQVETLRATIDGIMDDVTRVKADIILNKADIDGNLLDVTNRIDSVEASIPSSDEFYLKTGGDVNGYVYSKGDNSGYYLGSEDGSLLSKWIEKNPQESLFELRGRTAFKVTGFAPGDNEAFAYVDLDTSISNGLKIGRLADPVQSYDAVNKRYADSLIGNQFQHPGMGLQWQYNGSGSATTGRFSFVNDEFLYINGETVDGRKIFNDLNANQHSPHAARPLITIYRIVNNEMYLCMVLNCKETRFGYNSSGRMQFIVDAWLRPHPLNVGQNYYITVGGLC